MISIARGPFLGYVPWVFIRYLGKLEVAKYIAFLDVDVEV